MKNFKKNLILCVTRDLTNYKLGWTLLSGENDFNPCESRAFLYTQPFYTIIRKCLKNVVFGERPKEFEGVETINQQVLDKRRVYLERLENFPLKKAEYYKELQVTIGIKTVRELAEITGEDWSYIAKILRTLELPVAIQDYLKNHQEPEIVKHFHLKCLLEIVRLESEELQLARFGEMLGELNIE